MILSLKSRIEPIRPYLNYTVWLNHLITLELLFFGLQWLTCFVLVWLGIQFSIQFAGASPALVAANGSLILNIISAAACILWVFDFVSRIRLGKYERTEDNDGSPIGS
jgi:hypothetical protein